MSSVTRRNFLKGGLALGGAVGMGKSPLLKAQSPIRADIGLKLIDTHVGLFHWPFSRVKHDNPAELAEFLHGKGVSQAWAGSYECLFAKDMAAANRRLAESCSREGSGLFLPFGTVNPRLPDWEEDVRRCHEVHGMAGLRLYPSYQAWTLEDPRFPRLLELAAERSLLVQVVVWMEDERHHHPLMQVANVDLSPLPRILDQVPGVRIQVLNAFRNPASSSLKAIFDHKQITYDIAKVDVIDGLALLLEKAPVEHVLFGTHAPVFIWDAARLKLQESVLSNRQVLAICSGNAQRLLTAV